MLRAAARASDEGIVQQVLEAGADVTAVNNYGQTARGGHESIVKLLLEVERRCRLRSMMATRIL